MKSFSSHLLRRVALFGFAFILLAGAVTGRAGEAPTFSDPEATAFARDYSKFVDEYAAFMKDYVAAIKANDAAKAEAIAKKSEDLQTRQQNLQVKALAVQGRVKAEEAQKFSDFVDACTKRMVDSMQSQ